MVSGANLTENDPLVTLSYLTETFRTSLLEEVRKLAESAVEQVNAAADERARKLTPPPPLPAANATHENRELAAGEEYTVSAGNELMLLSGAAQVDSAGLTDATAGTAVAAGETLAVCHLYTAVFDTTVTATEAALLMVPAGK